MLACQLCNLIKVNSYRKMTWFDCSQHCDGICRHKWSQNIVVSMTVLSCKKIVQEQYSLSRWVLKQFRGMKVTLRLVLTFNDVILKLTNTFIMKPVFGSSFASCHDELCNACCIWHCGWDLEKYTCCFLTESYINQN